MQEQETHRNVALFGTQNAVVERSMARLQAMTAAHDASWGLGRADWQADLNQGTLSFITPGLRATCAAQVVGTYNTQNGSWLWGWGHPSVPAALAVDAGRVRAFAAEYQLSELLTPQLTCSEHDAWAFTALAAQLGNAQGAYRGPAGTALVFFTFGDVTLSQ